MKMALKWCDFFSSRGSKGAKALNTKKTEKDIQKLAKGNSCFSNALTLTLLSMNYLHRTSPGINFCWSQTLFIHITNSMQFFTGNATGMQVLLFFLSKQSSVLTILKWIRSMYRVGKKLILYIFSNSWVFQHQMANITSQLRI